MSTVAHDAPPASRWRFTRSATNLREAALHADPSLPAAPLSPTATTRERAPSSKLSIFTLFTRPKVERARGHTELGLALPMQPHHQQQQQPPPASQMAAPRSSLRQHPLPPSQQSIRARSSQLFRPASMRPMTPHNDFGDWEPPPLFQAFPQSLKHATVQACIFPPELLLRSQSQRRPVDAVRQRMESVRDLSTIAENGADATRADKADKNHKRLISNAVLSAASPTPEIVDKIYILVAAGYVLQYAGEGPFDRTPEKILKLGKDSAAFACDLIPGKHWVLQISSHAHHDATVEPGPKNSLLSRLRTPNAATPAPKTGATSFLLVLESAQEMDAWMSAIRKEIDALAGIKSNPESVRASSSSTDDAAGKCSADTISHRPMVQRDPETISKVTPWETPLVLPRSDSQRRSGASLADSTSGQSHQSHPTANAAHHRQSAELSSLASTPVSQHQVQLDGLRGRSRFSFMSNATSTSGPGTRNTSRESSPAPTSPRNGEAEPLRSAMSLKSFHMNPNNTSAASRRRSMQPLPTTNENFPHAMHTPARNQRHSLHSSSPASSPDEASNAAKDSDHAKMHGQSRNAPARNAAEPCPDPPTTMATREDSPVRMDARTFGIPPRREVISPPPCEPAPLPPAPPRSQSALGISTAYSSLPGASLLSGAALEARAQRRLSSTPKPFLRPLPVRPQTQHAEGSMIVPRRQSSLAPTTAPAPLPFGINVNRSVTAPARSPSAAGHPSPTSSPTIPPSALPSPQPLRRPSSVQIRSDPAPFLSSSRPVRAIPSTPSFVPGQRASSTHTLTPTARPLQSVPSIETLRQQALAHRYQMQAITTPKRSMPSLGLPPPAPPPTMPLPTLPPNMPLPPTPPTVSTPNGSALTPPTMPPPSICLPSTPPTMPSPTPPPSVPLPPTPPEAAAAARIFAA